MTLSEAAKAVNKSVKTIRRWQRDGIDTSNPTALREHSDFMDMRSRGASAARVWDRPSTATNAAPKMPGDASRALAGLDTLESLKAAFQKRLDKAKKIGDELETGLLSEELVYLTEAHRLLDIVCEGFEV